MPPFHQSFSLTLLKPSVHKKCHNSNALVKAKDVLYIPTNDNHFCTHLKQYLYLTIHKDKKVDGSNQTFQSLPDVKKEMENKIFSTWKVLIYKQDLDILYTG